MLPRPSRVPALVVALASTAFGLALPLLLVPAAGAPDAGRTWSDEPQHAAYSDVTFDATNRVRAGDRLRKLDAERCLRLFAREHVKRLAAEERLEHQDLRPILRRCDLQLVGENLAYGFATGEEVVEAWEDSRSHRANLLEPRYDLMAVVSRRSEDGTWYVAQLFGTDD